jgi:tetratricopeptide (TPR) repeat protein
MARAQAQRRRRARSHAQKSARSAEDLMFFPKLRRRAKWVFVLLVVAFGLGFVVYGVGTGVGGTNLGDVLQDFVGRKSTSSSLDDARKEALAQPKNADAQFAYASALQANGQTREAVAVLERYTAAKPGDTDALRQLANLWGILVSQAQREAQAAQAEAAEVTATKTFAQPSAKFLQDLEQNRIADQLAAQATTRANAAGAQAQAAASSQQKVYESLTKLVPEDPSLQLSLGIAAQQAGDYQTAVKAYKQFVSLAPNDPSVREVKSRIKLLESLVQPSG